MANPTAFSFTLDSFQITETRSLHNDTDFVTFTLLVKAANGTGTPQSLQKSMGDVNNGSHSMNLSFSNVPVHPGDTVTLNYLIVNAGHAAPGKAQTTLETVGNQLANSAGEAIFPGLGAAAKWLAGKLAGILTADCDGPVAAEQMVFTYNELVAKAGTSTYSHTTDHHGTDSATGCGSNSRYKVTWHMAAAKTIVLQPVQEEPQKMVTAEAASTRA